MGCFLYGAEGETNCWSGKTKPVLSVALTWAIGRNNGIDDQKREWTTNLTIWTIDQSSEIPRTWAICATISPVDEDCRKLRSLFGETLDTRIIALACLPKELRAERFLDQLTPENRTRLTNSALGLVIPDWRTLVTAGM